MAATATQRIYELLVDDEDAHGCGDLAEPACHEVPGNASKIVAALTLQKIGDRVVDPKTVLAWLFATLGTAPSPTSG